MDTKKISWQIRLALADKAISMKIFRVLSGISLFKKEFFAYPGSLTPYPFSIQFYFRKQAPFRSLGMEIDIEILKVNANFICDNFRQRH